MSLPLSNPYAWLYQDALDVAPRLLGWELVSNIGGVITAGRITEVEAYHGLADPASHAFRGPTPRTLPMFEAGGTIYVYLSYGIHSCMNIVTGPAGSGQALLIRALEPTRGLDAMMTRRRTTVLKNLASGPGKLTQALEITLTLSGTKLGEDLTLVPPVTPIAPAYILTSPRIGISRAKDYPWRFYTQNAHQSP